MSVKADKRRFPYPLDLYLTFPDRCSDWRDPRGFLHETGQDQLHTNESEQAGHGP